MDPLALLVFLAFAVVFYLLFLIVHRIRHAEREPLERRMASIAESTVMVEVASDPVGERRDLRETFNRMFGQGLLERTDKLLLQAAIPLRATEFLLVRAVTAVGLPILAHALSSNMWIMLGACATGIFFPGFFIKYRINKRVDLFSKQLADFLSLVVNGLRAGQTFLQGIEHATHDAKEPICGEFRRLLRETNLGLPIDTAFGNLCERVPSQDLEITSTVFLIQRNIGGNLAEVMDQVGAMIRERVKLQGQIKVLTAQGIMSGTVVGGLPIVLCVILRALNPDYMRLLFEHPTGKACLAGAVVMQIIGCLAIKKIVTIEL